MKQHQRSTQNVSLINTAHEAGHILSNAISRKTWKVKNFPHIIAPIESAKLSPGNYIARQSNAIKKYVFVCPTNGENIRESLFTLIQVPFPPKKYNGIDISDV